MNFRPAWFSMVSMRLTFGLVTVLLVTPMAWAQSQKHALLVGVGAFASPEMPPLQGPREDVAAIKEVLAAKWAYPTANIQTLIDSQGTKKAIVEGLKAILQRSKPGDEVFIYFTGHGTSALDPGLGLPVPDGSGAYGTYDARLSGTKPLETLLVGRTDLRPALEALDKGGRNVWVVVDACFSARLVRSVGSDKTGLVSKSLPVMNQDEKGRYFDMRKRAAEHYQAAGSYPYKNLVFLSAAAEGETAKDIPAAYLNVYPTIDGKPHGTLTDALLRGLLGKLPMDFNGDGAVSMVEMHQALGQFMAQRAYGHTPQFLPAIAEDTGGVNQRPILVGNGVVQPIWNNSPVQLKVDATILPEAVRSKLAAVPQVQWTDKEADYKLIGTKSKIRLASAAGDTLNEWPLDQVGLLAGQLQQLVWVQRIDRLASKNRRAVLAAEISPSFMGGNFLVGDKLHFDVRVDRAAKLLIVNVDSQGKVTVLYPDTANELQTKEASVRHAIPGAGANDQISVVEPYGMDMQLIVSFDQPGPDLSGWVGKRDTQSSFTLPELEKLLNEQAGRFAYTRTELRVLPKP